MRNACFTLCSLAFTAVPLSSLILLGGCRQTTGPTGALMPAGNFAAPNGALTPVAPGQTPAIGPFGGNTRVTPPSTGAINTPNNYMGGVAPTSFGAGLQNASPNQSFAAQPNGLTGSQGTFDSFSNLSNVRSEPIAGSTVNGFGQPIGSGIQTTSFQQPTNEFSPGQSFQTGTSQPGQRNPSDPRSGGMQVIDMTGAPNPPGYRPTIPNFSQPQQLPNQQPSQQPSQVNQFGNSQRAFGQQPFYPGNGIQMVGTLPPNQINRRLNPSFQSRGSDVPSTNPTNSVRAPSTNNLGDQSINVSNQLNWRRPGTQF